MLLQEAVSAISQRQLIAAASLALGGATVAISMIGLFLRARRSDPQPDRALSVSRLPGYSPVLLAVLVAILIAGAWLRLDGLDAKTLTHTEAIIPNIVWPPDSWPPTRTSFYDTFWWHFHGEGHPQGHYFFMWAWTKAFGTDLYSLRLPSALFGIGSILLAFLIGARLYNQQVGLLGAGLVAFNGLHIYFSQYSRMFMMASFLTLLSTWLLLFAVYAREHRLRWQIGYVLVSWLALYSLTFFWTVLAAQMLWLVLQRDVGSGVVRRVLTLQALVVMVGAPSMAHIIYRGDDVTLPGPSLSFLAEYVSFGFSLQTDPWSIPPRGFPLLLTVPVLILALVLAVRGAIADGRRVPAAAVTNSLSTRWLVGVAAGSALVVAGLTIVALRHQAAMAPVVLLPFAALALPAIGSMVHARFGQSPAMQRMSVGTAASMLREPRAIVALTAVLPPLIVFALSFWTSMLTARAFLVFVPFVLILIAAGTLTLVRRKAVLALVLVALAGVQLVGTVHWKRYPSEQFDYAALARGMNARMQPGDLLLVQPELWVITPLYYYLEERGQMLVTGDYHAAVAAASAQRVWLLYFDSYQWGSYGTTTDEMTDAVAGFQMQDEVTALRARAQLLARPLAPEPAARAPGEQATVAHAPREQARSPREQATPPSGRPGW